MFKLSKNTWFAIGGIILLVVIGALIYTNGDFSKILNVKFSKKLTSQEVAKKAIDYVNNVVLKGQSTVTMISFTDQDGFVKITMKLNTNQFDGYATKDGKYFFPEAFIMDKSTDTTVKNTATQDNKNYLTCDKLPKSTAPVLEAYIVSRCPFGLQMQRMAADAIAKNPSVAQYLKMRYMGSVSNNQIYSMHDNDESGKQIPNGKEGMENLRQICIREEQATKYWPYVSCQMKAGDTAGCEKSTGIDSAKLSSCISDTARGMAYAKADFALSDKYGVTGSPTLILNGQTVEEFTADNKPIFGSARSSDELREIVCCSSSTQPGFCSAKFSTTSAATSFSQTYAAAATSAGNSGSTGANCAPAQ